ncbi:MAG: hypothetical protein ACE5K7_00145 [Phycisphaerae bacterium]
MPPTQRSEAPRLLHVAAAGGQISGQFDEAIRSAGAVVEQTDNVYSAMVRLVRGDGRQFKAVLVCLDLLAESELEFFELVRRRFESMPVYVYGGGIVGERLERRTELTGVVRVEPGQLRDELAAAIGGSRAADDSSALAAEATAQPPEPEPQAPGGEPASAQEPPQRPSRPTRRPPQQARPPGQPTEDESGAALLSPEELAALLGKDDGRAERSEPSGRP